MIDHGVTLDLNKQMLFCQNMEMPINTGYVTKVESKRVIVDDNQSIPPKSEAIVWAKVNGGGGTEELDCGTNKNRYTHIGRKNACEN